MNLSIGEKIRIAQAETYAIPYIQLHEDVTKLSAVEFAQKVIKACEELNAAFGSTYKASEGAKQLTSDEAIALLRVDAYANAYVQAHYPVYEITAEQFAEYVAKAGNELIACFGKEEAK